MTDIDQMRGYLHINKDALDDEIQRQPRLFDEVGEAFIQAAAERDLAKEQLALVDSQIDAEVREDLANEKYTETMVRGLVINDLKHQQAFEAYMRAKVKADRLEVLKAAFQQRAGMIRDLCQLYMGQYFETTSVKGTPNTDAVVYQKQRERMAKSRVK